MSAKRPESFCRLVVVVGISLILALAGVQGGVLAGSVQSPVGQTVPTTTSAPAPTPTLTPTTVPTPVPPPSVPSGSNGVVFIPGQVSELEMSGGGAGVSVPGDALTEPGTLVIVPVDLAGAPSPPSGFAFAGLVVDILFYDANGNLVEGIDFLVPITFCMDATDGQMASYLSTDPHDPDMFTYDTNITPNAWVRVPNTFADTDSTPQRICAELSHLTLFAVVTGQEVAAAAEATTTAVEEATTPPEAEVTATPAAPAGVSGALVGIIVGVVVLIILAIVIFALAGRRRKEPPAGGPPPAKPEDRMPGKRADK